MSTKNTIRKIANKLAVVLLLFNGSGALYGGWMLMADPSGQKLQASPEMLHLATFNDFLIPGFVLFALIGVFSLTALAAMLFSLYRSAVFVLAEGLLLTGWIVIQALWTQTYHPLQAVMGAVGLLLTGCGWVLRKNVYNSGHYASLHHAITSKQSTL